MFASLPQGADARPHAPSVRVRMPGHVGGREGQMMTASKPPARVPSRADPERVEDRPLAPPQGSWVRWTLDALITGVGASIRRRLGRLHRRRHDEVPGQPRTRRAVSRSSGPPVTAGADAVENQAAPGPRPPDLAAPQSGHVAGRPPAGAPGAIGGTNGAVPAPIEVRMPDHGARRIPKAVLLAVYGLAIAGPLLLVALRDHGQPRPFVAELGSGLGIAALSLLTLQLIVPARLPLLSSIGAEVAVRLHRRLADVLIAVVAAHLAAVMIADPSRLALLTFFGEPWRAQAAIGSVAALAALMVTSVVRRRVRLSYVAWRAIHLGLAAGALVLAVVHTIGVGRYLVTGAAEWSLVALTLGGLGALVILRGRWIRRGSVRPYRVERVVEERGGAVTLQLRADGHRGQQFIPGQFAWLKQPQLRALLAEHPFSYASSAEAPGRPTFTMKTRDGFTAQAAAFSPGTELLVDGPHGAFRPRAAAAGMLLIGGGIGITPSMSVLRTAADRDDRRPYLLVYAARSLDDVTFAEELEALRERVNLTIVYVLSAPPPEWAGERGRINAGVLDRHLPADVRRWQFLVCGSGPFVDGAMAALEAVGIPGERVHAEQFVEV